MSTLLAVRHLFKTFPGQVALDDFDVSIGAGRTHALVGQNGSGKSTFIKILAGYHQPDPGGEATMDGSSLRLGDGRAAQEAGIRFVHQDLGLVDMFNSVENISLGAGYTTGFGKRIDWAADTRRANAALSDLGFTDIDVTVPVAALAPSQRTAVAIARALHDWEAGAHLLVLDEPTASLPGADVERLFTAIRRLKERGVGILYVSHHLDEVFAIADDVTVLRDGRRVDTVVTDTLDHDGLIELMIGYRLDRRNHSQKHATDSTDGLDVRGLTGGTVTGVDLRIEPGEVVGIAGITGSGREMLAPLVTGQVPSDEGSVHVAGTAIANYSPRAALRAGMAFVPTDRAKQGVIALQSVLVNITICDVKRHWRRGRLRHGEEKVEVLEWIRRLDIKTQGTENPIATLSGGNQQKVLFGRSLRLEPAVLVLDDPTHGVDVGAKEEIHSLIDRAAENGAAVLVASTDTDELVRLSHRIVIMVAGRIASVLTGSEMTSENIELAQLNSLDRAGSA